MPDWKAEARRRIAGLGFEPTRAEEIADELAQHLDDRCAELIAAGMPGDAAERAVLSELDASGGLRKGLGSLRRAHAPQPLVIGEPGGGWLRGAWNDVRFGLRTLRKSPGFAAAAVLTLALGVGANTAIFSLVNAVLLQRLPVRDSRQLVHASFEGGGVMSYPEYADMRDHGHGFASLAAFGGIVVSLNRGGTAELANGLIVTGNYFDTLGVRPALGRLIGPNDDVTPGAHPVVVLAHDFWRARFGADPALVGRELLINGHRFTVIGVSAPGFHGSELGGERGMFIPMMMQAVVRPPRAGYSGDMDPDLLKRRTNRWLFLVGRLAEGASPEQVASSLAAIAEAGSEPRPAGVQPRRVVAVPVDIGDPEERAQLRAVASLLMAVVGAVLLLACANVANLLLSKAAARRREIAVRLALGASRFRLVRQLVTESVLLAAIGSALGLLLAYWATSAAAGAVPQGALPIAVRVAIDTRVLLFTGALALLAGLAFGLAPGLVATRAGLVAALKDESFVPDERARHFNLRSALVVSQLALSVMLLVAAGLFLRNLRELQAVRPGFDVERLLQAQLPINLLRYTQAQGAAFYRDVVERVESLPGVESAAVARVPVLAGSGRVSSLHIEGREGSQDRFQSEGGGVATSRLDAVNSNVIGPGYFRTLGLALLAGRDFEPADTEQAPVVALVNESFWRLHFADRQAAGVLGQRVSVNGPEGPWRAIVGVVADAKYGSLTEDRVPVLYVPLAQRHETGMTLYVRASGDPAGLLATVRREVQALDPNLPLPELRTVRDTVASSLWIARMGAILLGAFAGLALLLAAIGVYGVVSFGVAQRTREIGLRMALGAGARSVQGMVLKQGLRLVAAGLSIGLVLAVVEARFLESLLFGVSGRDPLTFALVPLVLAVVALVACLLPARRATRLDPLTALRYR
jgi:predicted permease